MSLKYVQYVTRGCARYYWIPAFFFFSKGYNNSVWCNMLPLFIWSSAVYRPFFQPQPRMYFLWFSFTRPSEKLQHNAEYSVHIPSQFGIYYFTGGKIWAFNSYSSLEVSIASLWRQRLKRLLDYHNSLCLFYNSSNYLRPHTGPRPLYSHTQHPSTSAWTCSYTARKQTLCTSAVSNS